MFIYLLLTCDWEKKKKEKTTTTTAAALIRLEAENRAMMRSSLQETQRDIISIFLNNAVPYVWKYELSIESIANKLKSIH